METHINEYGVAYVSLYDIPPIKDWRLSSPEGCVHNLRPFGTTIGQYTSWSVLTDNGGIVQVQKFDSGRWGIGNGLFGFVAGTPQEAVFELAARVAWAIQEGYVVSGYRWWSEVAN